MAKVCESLGLAVNLKVKLESISERCFQSVQWLSHVSTWPILFKEQGSIKVWSCLWKWIMSRTKEITEDLRKRVDVAHQARKGYKTISKEFGLHKSTVRQIVYKWRNSRHCYLPEKWLTNKDHSKAERVIVCEAAKVPRVTSKQLKAFLTLVNVHEPTIRTTLSNHGVHTELQEESHCSPKRKLLAKSCRQARGLLEKGLMDGWNQNRTYWFNWRSCYVRRKEHTLRSSLRILSHLWNMVVVVSWLGPVLLHLGQDSLPSLMEILKF